MRRLSLVLPAFALVAVQANTVLGQASAVTGVLLEAQMARPVPGAAVFLVDSTASATAVVLSDEAGRFQLRAPGAGIYRLRVERIGLETEWSAAFAVGHEGVREVSMGLSIRPIELDPLPVEAGRVCRVDSGASQLAKVWWEARKALLATVLSAERPGVLWINRLDGG